MQQPSFRLTWQLLEHPTLRAQQCELWIVSLTTELPALSGNKYLKLKYHIHHIQQGLKQGILTFGGAFSNHLAAVAAAGQHFSFPTVGLVRSHSPLPNNPTLDFCRHMGMQLIAIDRQQYRQRHDPNWLAELAAAYPDYQLVPEGGSDEIGVAGAASIALHHTPTGLADFLVCATGTGGTLAGLSQQFPGICIGVDVVGDPSTTEKLSRWQVDTKRWQLLPSVDTSGYGKFNQVTWQLVLDCAKQQLLLEPIYTAKALATLLDAITTQQLPGQRRYAFFHSGGLQGLAGLAQQQRIPASDWLALRLQFPTWLT